MPCDAMRDREVDGDAGGVHCGVQLLLVRVEQEHGGDLGSNQSLCLVHDSPQHALNAQVGIHQQGALHEGVDRAQKRRVAHETGRGVGALQGLPDGPAVHAEDLLEILLDGVAQGMVRKHVRLGQKHTTHRRGAVVLQPALNVAPLVAVAICQDDGVVHALLGDGAVERRRVLPLRGRRAFTGGVALTRAGAALPKVAQKVIGKRRRRAKVLASHLQGRKWL
mmetsp:Transcript_125818/g.402778  ORF Transcript_125818/g.402778 Transcript_125818/m.402778 type:complete len:222 (-) Transcript_125818:36-701(-)